jgi:hypothetical protein
MKTNNNLNDIQHKAQKNVNKYKIREISIENQSIARYHDCIHVCQNVVSMIMIYVILEVHQRFLNKFSNTFFE